jgi:hypothetical protein
MLEQLDTDLKDADIAKMVDRYIDESTEIKTIYQMEWFENIIIKPGRNHEVHDVWRYKDEYNSRHTVCAY